MSQSQLAFCKASETHLGSLRTFIGLYRGKRFRASLTSAGRLYCGVLGLLPDLVTALGEAFGLWGLWAYIGFRV